MKKVLLKFRVKKKLLVKFRNQNQGRITLKAGWSQDQLDLKKKIYIYICRVSVFRPGPLQWICREWVQKLGSDEATASFGGEKYTEPNGPTSQGERAPRPKTGTPNSSRIPRASLLSMGLLASPLCFGWSLLLYTPLFRSSSSYTCQSSMSILERMSHRPLFLTPCELLWPPPHCPGVTSTSTGSGC